ncbi:hypothetical protein LguiA_004711 [Lonicera macranthoides]
MVMFFFSGKTKNMSIRLKNGKSVRARPWITFTTEGASSLEQSTSRTHSE